MKVIQDWPMFIAAANTKTLRPVLHASTPSKAERISNLYTSASLYYLRELTVIKELAQWATLSRPPSRAQPTSVKRPFIFNGKE
jgi:hypothetical protein